MRSEAKARRALLDAIASRRCGDHSCIHGNGGGMATNGGCRCFAYGDSATVWKHRYLELVNELLASLAL